jgi:hypothetical protein
MAKMPALDKLTLAQLTHYWVVYLMDDDTRHACLHILI